jgi:hypothetical protein
MKPGQPARYDYEYERNGTANLFMLATLEAWRHVKVTDRHTAVDVNVLKELSDTHLPDAKKNRAGPGQSQYAHASLTLRIIPGR